MILFDESPDYWMEEIPDEEPRFCDQCMSNHPNTTPCHDWPEEED